MAVFWTGGCTGDVADHHHYPEPQVPFDLAEIAAARRMPFLQGEYGGYSLSVSTHVWNATCAGLNTQTGGERMGSRAQSTRAALPDEGLQGAFERYNNISSGLLKQGLAGQIFTQITDIECEVNGLLTYDRVAKVDLKRIHAANEALLAAANA